MSDPVVKFDWVDSAQRVGLGLVSVVVGVLVRLLFGRAIKELDEKLGEIPKLRGDMKKLQDRVDALEGPPPPQPTPKVGP